MAMVAGIVAVLLIGGAQVPAQSDTFGGNAQHTGLYNATAQRLNRQLWSTSIDLNNTGAYAHYGAPLITPSNTVIVPVKIATGFKVNVFEGSTGRLKYTLATDYILPPLAAGGWIPAYQPVIASNVSGPRLYYAGAGGTVYYVDNPDSDTPGAPVQLCFYTSLTNYFTNMSVFTNRIFVNTPLTADTNGVVFFGFRLATNGAPAPLNTTNGGYARLDSAGNGSYVLAGPAAGDTLVYRDSHNCAPALSADGSTLYVAVKGATANYSYLLGLDSTTLATKYKVRLRDPRNTNGASVPDDGTASPMVAPDGDVFFGVLGNPGNGSRGFLMRFSADLATQKPPSAFGWDYTPAIVPTNMVPGYTGTSSYLIFSKYNNYASTPDADGINRLALLDPNATQIDPHPSAPGLVEMREVMTVIGCTPDIENMGATYPYAVREWCINASAVNPATKSIFAPSEDGRIYRWNLAANSLTETMRLSPGVGEPYVPTVIGPDGTVYTLNGGTLFALGSLTNVAVALFSSVPDLRSVVAGQAVTFTAVVTNLDGTGPAPTGTVSFEDVTYQGLNPVTNMLASNVPLTGGLAVVTTSTLLAASNYLGSHFITASYSGDGSFPSGSATLVQKIHSRATTTTLSSTGPLPGTNAVTFTATVASSPPGGGTPKGMVSFWDGATFLAQRPLNTSGLASFTTTNLTSGSHVITASYASDTLFASSTGILIGTPVQLDAVTLLGNGDVRLTFTNVSGAPFVMLGTTDLLLPLSLWSELGAVTEIQPGMFQFTDTQASSNTTRYYRARSP